MWNPVHSAVEPDSLTRLFNPRSVAIIGASDDGARISGRPLRYLREGGFQGAIYPVNPKRDTVQGLRAYASLAALPEVPDVAIITVAAELTLPALQDCAVHGIRAVMLFAAGYAEASAAGAQAQNALADLAQTAGMRLLGPNCLGIFNAETRYWGTFSSTLDLGFATPGGLAVASQSGAYGAHIAYLAKGRGLGVSYCLTTGNEADVDLAECLLWLIERPEVRVVMAYAEGIKKPSLFLQALRRAHALRKPIVILKVGQSQVGQRAVGSHTAALAGSDAVYDAVFRQYGVHRAFSAEEQLDVAYACLRGLFPIGRKLGIVTVSGGAGIHLSDIAERYGLDVSPMPLEAQRKLTANLPYAAPENPVDVTAQALNDMGVLNQGLRLMLDEGGYDALVGFFTTVPSAPSFAVALRETLLHSVGARRDRLIALCMVADTATVRDYEQAGYLVFVDEARAVAALAALMCFADAWAQPLPEIAIAPGAASIPRLGLEPLSEYAAKRLLAAAGVPVPAEHLVRTANEACEAASPTGSVPDSAFALKIVSPDLLHKTEVGGVALNVPTASVRSAFDTLMMHVRAAAPQARIEGVLVTPMASRGVETIIGVVRDATFGPVVMFGLGGIFVEVLKDVTFRLAPFDEAEALRMIGEVRGARALLAGARGAPAADVAALAATLAAVSRFAAAHSSDLDSLDINPFLVLPQGQGGLALDAAIVTRVQKDAGSDVTRPRGHSKLDQENKP